jgi:hypothetical protein
MAKRNGQPKARAASRPLGLASGFIFRFSTNWVDAPAAPIGYRIRGSVTNVARSTTGVTKTTITGREVYFVDVNFDDTWLPGDELIFDDTVDEDRIPLTSAWLCMVLLQLTQYAGGIRKFKTAALPDLDERIEVIEKTVGVAP